MRASESSAIAGSSALRGLWLSRELPFPQDMGDRIYSANLARSLADAGVDLTLAGLSPAAGVRVPSHWPIRWIIIEGKARSRARSLLSTMPLVAAAHATAEYRQSLTRVLRQADWNFVVLDQYGMGWALEHVAKWRAEARGRVLIHVAHDHESTLLESLYRNYRGSRLQRIALWQNYLKTRVFERRIARTVDLISAITEDDACRFKRDAPEVRAVVVKPGYAGKPSPHRCITKVTPRRVVLVGSFSWVAKQENLRQFIEVADPIFAGRGIEFQVIGFLPASFAESVARGTRALRIMGPVERLEPYFASSRIAIVPEAIGGGFKLKFLDYIFGRMPVATLAQATAGLPAEIVRGMLCCDSLRDLALGTADLIDQIDRLNEMQEVAFSRALALYRWIDRGIALRAAIEECIARRMS